MALTSVFYDGVVTETDRAINLAGSPQYGVYGVDDFKVTAHPTIPYAVLTKAGRAHGHGVTDTAAIDQVVQCDTLASGTRWDLIVVRRNWQPALGGPSTLEAIPAGAVAEIPAARKVGPGVEDDQPIALVKWTGGLSAPQQIIDLRVWASNGSLYATDDLVRGYLTGIGTRVNINGVDWSYLIGANDLLGWVRGASIQNVSFIPETGYTFTGQLTRISDGTVSRAHLAGRITRSAGGPGPLLTGAWVRVMTLFLPPSMVPPSGQPADTYANLASGFDNLGNPIITARVNVAIKNDRSLWARLDTGSYTWPLGGSMYVDMSWPL